MFRCNGKTYKEIGIIKKEYNLISNAELMKFCNCGINGLQELIEKNNPQVVEVLQEPSGRMLKFYNRDDFKNLELIKKDRMKNEEIPMGYISKKEFCEKLGIKLSILNSIVYWCNDFNKYSIQLYINNIKKRFYLVNEDALKFYQEKINKYYNPNRRNSEKKLNNLNNNISGLLFQSAQNETRNYKHHQIKIDKTVLSYMLDTASVYYKKLIEIYKHYSSQIVADVSMMELHHIVPRFYVRNGAYYSEINSLENLIYLPPNIHFLVHFLEYKCSLPVYKDKFFSACCIKVSTLDSENIEEKYINEITNLFIKAFFH